MRTFSLERIQSPVIDFAFPVCCAVPKSIWNRNLEGAKIPASSSGQSTESQGSAESHMLQGDCCPMLGMYCKKGVGASKVELHDTVSIMGMYLESEKYRTSVVGMIFLVIKGLERREYLSLQDAPAEHR